MWVGIMFHRQVTVYYIRLFPNIVLSFVISSLFGMATNHSRQKCSGLIFRVCHCINQNLKEHITGCVALLELLDKPSFDINNITGLSLWLDYSHIHPVGSFQ